MATQPQEGIVSRYTRWVIRRRWWVLAAAFVVTVAAGAGVRNLGLSTDRCTMRGIVQRSFEAAQRDGDLPTELSAPDMALLFMSMAWGIHVMAEAGIPKAELKKAAAQLFAMSRTPA